MKQRLADYVADFLAAHGVTDVFSVVGGGAMHLNDALGHHPALHVTYNHHEQASAIAAEAYARIDNKIAALCVTTGPGGTNALTGVVGGWLDSIPMFVISGQVRYDTTARYAAQFTDGLPLRAVGDQEYDITKSVAPMTKYATMLEDPNQIRYVLEKAWHLATTGRPGPVWIDIPVNYQGGYIETDSLPGYDPAQDDARLPPPVDDATVQMVLEKIRHAKRPVFHAGYGVRLSGGQAQRLALARTLAHQRPLLILDDPFSALDRATETEIFAHLRRLAADSVVILISHRLYLFPELDRVIWLENGEAKVGTHEELVGNTPDYAAQFDAQREENSHE